MATDCFLKVDGIPGESKDAWHKDEIEVFAFRWGVQFSGPNGEGGDGLRQNVDNKFYSWVKWDKSAPKWLHHVSTGEHIRSAILTCRKAGGKQLDFMTWTMTDLIVDSIQASSPGKLDDILSISFNFVEIETEYHEQKADGSLGPATKVKYNFKGKHGR